MNTVLRNILAVLAGLLLGSLTNMGLIMLGGNIIPPPAGVDVTNMESIAAAMSSFGPEHFLFPFLAHALGTLVGALVAVKIGASRHIALAMIIGGLFFIGGLVNVILLPAPLWFELVDLLLAYIPMAWIGWKLGGGSVS